MSSGMSTRWHVQCAMEGKNFHPMQNLTSILDDLTNDHEDEQTSLGSVIADFENRGFGPLLLVPAIIVLLPIVGAIPGVPAICALLIILIASQMLFGRQHPWIPGFLSKRKIEQKKVDSAVDAARPWAKRIDKVFSQRLEFLTGDIASRIVAIVAIFLAIVMIPLEAVPFAAAIPAASIALLALSLSAKDGLLTAIGLLSTAGTIYALMKWLPAIGEWFSKTF